MKIAWLTDCPRTGGVVFTGHEQATATGSSCMQGLGAYLLQQRIVEAFDEVRVLQVTAKVLGILDREDCESKHRQT